MTQKNTKRIRIIWGILSSGLIVIAGICLMAACLGIYLSGDKPFSREAVAQAFTPIAVPVYLSIAAILLGFLMHLLLPAEHKKTFPIRQDALILKRLQAGTDPSALSPEAADRILLLQRRRSLYRIITAALLTLGSLCFVLFLLLADRFPAAGINEAMARNVSMLFACLGLPFCWSIFAVYQQKAAIRAEIDILKKAGVKPVNTKAQTASKDTALNAARIVIACAAVGILLYGFFAGGMADVLTKAVNICTECVGLG